jgi:CBS domain-containing protein
MPAKDVMSTPLFCLHPSDSLWLAHEEMHRRHVRRLIVAEAGENWWELFPKAVCYKC